MLIYYCLREGQAKGVHIFLPPCFSQCLLRLLTHPTRREQSEKWGPKNLRPRLRRNGGTPADASAGVIAAPVTLRPVSAPRSARSTHPASASVFADCPSANALPARSNQAQGAVVKNRLWERACSRLVRQGSRASPLPPHPTKSVLRKRSDRTLAQARCFRDHIRLIASIIWLLMVICYH